MKLRDVLILVGVFVLCAGGSAVVVPMIKGTKAQASPMVKLPAVVVAESPPVTEPSPPPKNSASTPTELVTTEKKSVPGIAVQIHEVKPGKVTELRFEERVTIISVSAQSNEEYAAGEELARQNLAELEEGLKKKRTELEIAKEKVDNKTKLGKASATLEYKQGEDRQITQLLRSGSASSSEAARIRHELEIARQGVSDAKSEAKIDELTVKLIESEIRLIQEGIQRRTMVAPYSGQVLRVYRSAPYLPIESQENVMRYGNLEFIEVLGAIDVSVGIDPRVVRQGATVKMYLDRNPTEETPYCTGEITAVSAETTSPGIREVIIRVKNQRRRDDPKLWVLVPGESNYGVYVDQPSSTLTISANK